MYDLFQFFMQINYTSDQFGKSSSYRSLSYLFYEMGRLIQDISEGLSGSKIQTYESAFLKSCSDKIHC